MAVIGNRPATNFQSIKKQTITGTGDSSYSLDYAVSNANDLEVFVNNVRQEPTIAYSATSQTITFSEAIDSTDDVYMIYQGQTMGSVVHPADQALTATDGTFAGKVVVGSKDSGELNALSFDSADKGTMFYDETNNVMKHWDGTKFLQMSNAFAAEGGTESTYTSGGKNYKVHTFTSSGNFIVKSGAVEVEYVVVAGGGQGGADDGGGGGAGGYRSSVSGENSGGGNSAETPLTLGPGSYTVTIGAGAPGNDHTVARTQNAGGNSVFHTITSNGGGAGGNSYSSGEHSGLSGGSGGGNHQGKNSTAAGGSGTSGQGYAGGRGDDGTDGVWAGGGGGAAEAGNTDGDSYGGDGVASSITGTSVTRAGGGGGATRQQSSARPGGDGGGGNGSHNTSANTGSAGSANTGGGGGGGPGSGSNNERRGHAGGSGIVILRYEI